MAAAKPKLIKEQEEQDQTKKTKKPHITVYTNDAIPINWSATDDEALLNEILGQARNFLNAAELAPSDLREIMSIAEQAMRRKRINSMGYDTAPVAEIARQANKREEEDDDAPKVPIVRLHPDQKADAL